MVTLLHEPLLCNCNAVAVRKAKRKTSWWFPQRLDQQRKMAHGLVDLPMKLLMPSSFDNIKEIAFKTIPSASKVEIRAVLESNYGFEVEKVRTLNMQGKKKRRSGRLIARPNYKKAYVTLKNPISFASDVVSQGNG